MSPQNVIPDLIAGDSLDWDGISAALDRRGFAVAPRLLCAEECESLRALYSIDEHFRKRVVMARHGFGRGEYRYFNYPLPDLVSQLRTSLYPKLAAIANRWNKALGVSVHYPSELDSYLRRCHRAGQREPTPLLLRYGEGDYNCLHQDLYGENVFPLQIAVQLSEPDEDFAGGAFVLTEQRPRMQSRVEVVPLKRGDAVIFPVQYRPILGKRGHYRVNMRHGLSQVSQGKRFCLGVIFHDAA